MSPATVISSVHGCIAHKTASFVGDTSKRRLCHTLDVVQSSATRTSWRGKFVADWEPCRAYGQPQYEHHSWTIWGFETKPCPLSGQMFSWLFAVWATQLPGVLASPSGQAGPGCFYPGRTAPPTWSCRWAKCWLGYCLWSAGENSVCLDPSASCYKPIPHSPSQPESHWWNPTDSPANPRGPDQNGDSQEVTHNVGGA